ncbi:hypothetical protein HXX76_002143 [Chlamydomonas incerta]|uniref:Uncharacterized protein n=1 Tax=Chlamydomonas incerta TaxID=51695 RepID=A0A835WAI2_CHLIN|nr:hypothetical protein HXX76_002143 [Chlamydomonas incerta]|eukprot:KAG2443800.1 hypothetical protein HXX76_002143 [Chlamydomonas incerta]
MRICRNGAVLPDTYVDVYWEEGPQDGVFTPTGLAGVQLAEHLQGCYLQGFRWLDAARTQLVAVAWDQPPPGCRLLGTRRILLGTANTILQQASTAEAEGSAGAPRPAANSQQRLQQQTGPLPPLSAGAVEGRGLHGDRQRAGAASGEAAAVADTVGKAADEDSGTAAARGKRPAAGPAAAAEQSEPWQGDGAAAATMAAAKRIKLEPASASAPAVVAEERVGGTVTSAAELRALEQLLRLLPASLAAIGAPEEALEDPGPGGSGQAAPQQRRVKPLKLYRLLGTGDEPPIVVDANSRDTGGGFARDLSGSALVGAEQQRCRLVQLRLPEPLEGKDQGEQQLRQQVLKLLLQQQQQQAASRAACGDASEGAAAAAEAAVAPANSGGGDAPEVAAAAVHGLLAGPHEAEVEELEEPTSELLIRTLPWISMHVARSWYPGSCEGPEYVPFPVIVAIELDGVLLPGRYPAHLKPYPCNNSVFVPGLPVKMVKGLVRVGWRRLRDRTLVLQVRTPSGPPAQG